MSGRQRQSAAARRFQRMRGASAALFVGMLVIALLPGHATAAPAPQQPAPPIAASSSHADRAKAGRDGAEAAKNKKSSGQPGGVTPRNASGSGIATSDLTQLTAADLAARLIGGAGTVANAQFTGAPAAAGSFDDYTGAIGLTGGIVLSSGDIADVKGPNVSDGITTNFQRPGNGDLNAQVGRSTYDAAVLEFDLTPNTETINLWYVFASDEYNEYTNSPYDDPFAFFVGPSSNRQNVAVLPDGSHVSVNRVNGGNPLGFNASNASIWRNNDMNDGGGAYNTEMDGLTIIQPIRLSLPKDVTTHITIAIADAADQILDSAVFLTSAQPGSGIYYPEDSWFITSDRTPSVVTVSSAIGASATARDATGAETRSGTLWPWSWTMTGGGSLVIHGIGGGSADIFIDGNLAATAVGGCDRTRLTSVPVTGRGDHTVDIRNVTSNATAGCPDGRWLFDGIEWGGPIPGTSQRDCRVQDGTVDNGRVTVYYPINLMTWGGTPSGLSAAPQTLSRDVAQQIAARGEATLKYFADDLGLPVSSHVDIRIVCHATLPIPLPEPDPGTGVFYPAVPNDPPGFTQSHNDVQLREANIREWFVSGNTAWQVNLDHELFHTVQYMVKGDAGMWWAYIGIGGPAPLPQGNQTIIESSAAVGQDTVVPTDDTDPAGRWGAAPSYLALISGYYGDPVSLGVMGDKGIRNYEAAGLLQYLAEQFGDQGIKDNLERRVARWLILDVIARSSAGVQSIAEAIGNRDKYYRAVFDYFLAALVHDDTAAGSAFRFLDEVTPNHTAPGVTPAHYPTFTPVLRAATSLPYSEPDVEVTGGVPKVEVIKVPAGSGTVTVTITPKDDWSNVWVRVLPYRQSADFPDTSSDKPVLASEVRPYTFPVSTAGYGSQILVETMPDGEGSARYDLVVDTQGPKITILRPTTARPQQLSIFQKQCVDIMLTATVAGVEQHGLGPYFYGAIGSTPIYHGYPSIGALGGEPDPYHDSRDEYQFYLCPSKYVQPGTYDLTVYLQGSSSVVMPAAVVVPANELGSPSRTGGAARTATSTGSVFGDLLVEGSRAGEPIVAQLVLGDGVAPLRQATATATITAPSGATRIFALRDDGKSWDNLPNDDAFGVEAWGTDEQGDYTIAVAASGLDSSGNPFTWSDAQTLTLAAKVDSDGDGVADGAETILGLDPANPTDGTADQDGDGLSTAAELGAATDPFAFDTDGGGEGDQSELTAGRNPRLSTDDVRPPSVNFNGRIEDGFTIRLFVGTEDGAAPVDVYRVAGGTRELLGRFVGKSSEFVDTPSVHSGLVYEAVPVAPNGEQWQPVRFGPLALTADATPPTVRFDLNAGAWVAPSRTVTAGFSADSDATQVRIADSPAQLEAAAWQPFASSLEYQLPATEGPHEVFAQVRDAAGNASGEMSAWIVLDTTGPAVSMDALPATTSARTVTLVTRASDATQVIDENLWMRFRASDTAAWGAWRSVGGVIADSTAYTFESGRGYYEFALSARDGVGHMTLPASAQASTYFTGAITTVAGPIAGIVTTTKLDVPYAVVDAGAGVFSIELWSRYRSSAAASWTAWAQAASGKSSPISFTFGQGPGQYELFTVGVDKKRDHEPAPTVADVAVTYDPDPPATVAHAPSLVAASPITVTFDASEDVSGIATVDLYARYRDTAGTVVNDWTKVASTAWQTATTFLVSSSGDGTYDFYTVATDHAGNVESPPATPDATTIVDTHAPTSAASALPPAVNVGSQSIAFTATDVSSSVASVELWQRFKPAGGSAGTFSQIAAKTDLSPFSVNLNLGDGTYDFYTIAVDAAGNREGVPQAWGLFGYYTVPDTTTVLDTVVPTSSVSSLPAGVASPSLSVPFTSSDGNGSGIGSVTLYRRYQALGSSDWTPWAAAASGSTSPFSQTLDQGPGRYEFYSVALDKAGNAEAAPLTPDAFTVYDSGAPTTHAGPLPAATKTNTVSLPYTVGPGTPPASVEIWWRFRSAGSQTWGAWSKRTTVTSSPASVDIGGSNGVAEFYTIGVSAAGIRETKPQAAEASIIRDTAAPTSAAAAPAYANTQSIQVPYTFADNADGSGVASIDLFWRFTPPGGSTGAWSRLATTTSVGTPFAVDLNQGSGRYDFYTQATDALGNVESVSQSSDSSTVFEQTAPTSSANALPAAVASTTLSVPYSASDNANGSGIGSVELWCRFAPAGSSTFTSWALVATKTSSPFSITLGQGDGRYECYTIAVDRSGNREAAPAGADDWTVLDTVTPSSVPGSLPPITTATAIDIRYTVSVADPAGTAVSVLLYQRSQNPTTLVWSSWSNSKTVANGSTLTASLSSDGRYEFYTIARDAAGNTEVKAQGAEVFTVRDRTAPVTTVTPLPGLTTQTAQTIAFSCSDRGGTGVVSLQLYARFVPAGSSTWTAWSLLASPSPTATSIDVTLDRGDGRYEYYFVGTDAAGNVESGGSYDTYTVLDRAAPTSRANSLAAAVNGTTLSVGYTATEPSNSAGVASVDLYWRFTPAGGTAGAWSYLATATSSPFSVALYQGDGRYEFYTTAVDKAGNAESKPAPTVEAYTVLDTIGETSRAGSIVSLTNATSINIPYTVTTPDPNGTAVTVELWSRFQPAGSTTWGSWAKAKSVANGATLTASFGNDGTYEFYTIARDAAGNVESKAQAAETWTVRDRTAPVSSATALNAASGSTTHEVGYSATDTNGSGVVSVQLQQRFQAAGSGTWSAWTTIATPSSSPVTVTLGPGDGRYEFRTIATDLAGNVEAAPSAADGFVILDRTTPTSTVAAPLPPSISSGSSVAVTYSATDNTNSAGIASVELQTRYRADDTVSGGTWTLVTTSSSSSGTFTVPFSSGAGVYDVAIVAVDALGNREATSVKTTVRAVTWATSSRVNSDAGAMLQDDIAFAVGPDGTIYAAWEDSRNGDQDIYFSSRDPSTGTWTPEIKLNTDAGSASQRTPSIAVDGSGDVYVVWADDRAGSTDTDIYFAKRTASSWGPNTKLNNDSGAAVQDRPRIAVTPAGMAVAVWVDGRSAQANVYSARLAAGSTSWSTNYKATSNTTAPKAAPDVALGSDGTAFAVWQDNQSNAGDIFFATLGPTATSWSTNSRVSDDSLTTGFDSVPEIGVASNGNVLVAWLDGRTPAAQVRVRQRTGTSWSASVQASDAAAAPLSKVALAVKPDGSVIVAWDDERGATSAIWGTQCEAGSSAVSRCAPAEAWSDQSGAAMHPVLVATASNVYLGWRDDTAGDGDTRLRVRIPS